MTGILLKRTIENIPQRTAEMTARAGMRFVKNASRNSARSGPVKSPVKNRAFASRESFISTAMNAQPVLRTAQRRVQRFAFASVPADSLRTRRISLTVVLPRALIALERLLIAAA